MFKNFYANAKNLFFHSETIFWARLQLMLGVIWAVVSVTDMSPLLSPKWFAIWGIANGVIIEILRRRNTFTETHMVPEVATAEMVPITTLVTIPITKV